jgi:hypothetical protein
MKIAAVAAAVLAIAGCGSITRTPAPAGTALAAPAGTKGSAVAAQQPVRPGRHRVHRHRPERR